MVKIVLRTTQSLIFLILVLVSLGITQAYILIPGDFEDIMPGDDLNMVLETLGSSCGTAHFKCDGIRKEGGVAKYYQEWEQNTILGSHRLAVYFDGDDMVVDTDIRFQWFYEASGPCGK